MIRTYYIRSPHALTFIPVDGEGEGMSGLFSKLHKAIAKPFTKIFKPNTLLGKVADPFGLMSRNVNLGGRIADVVGTAALAVTGAYAVGAASGATGGFWATAGQGASVIGSKTLAAGKAIGGALGTTAKAAAGVLGPALLSGGRVGAMGAEPTATIPQEALMTLPTSGASGAMEGGGIMPLSPSAGGGAMGPDASGYGGSAEVEVTDTMPTDEGPNWLLIAGGAAALFLAYKLATSKKG